MKFVRYNLKRYKNGSPKRKILKISLLISAGAEWQAVRTFYPDVPVAPSPFGDAMHLKIESWSLDLLHTGWGKIASAAAMQYVIDQESPDLVVNLGTCGGFEGEVHQGEILLVERTFVYDIVELMEAEDISPFYSTALDMSWLPEPYPHPARRAVVASADSDLMPERIPQLRSKGAIAADWESAALAWVAQRNNTRLLILRGVSDIVGKHGSDAYDNYGVSRPGPGRS